LGEVGEYDGEVGLYDGEVGEYEGLVGLTLLPPPYAGLVGE
jgi:hypothetical protein